MQSAIDQANRIASLAELCQALALHLENGIQDSGRTWNQLHSFLEAITLLAQELSNHLQEKGNL